MKSVRSIRHYKASVSVSKETADLIELGKYYGDLSGGKFDITIASASDLWNFHNNADHSIPDAEQLSEAVTHINYKTIEVNGTTITMSDPYAKIDLGGIAKGYIADQVKNYLIEEGIEHAYINLGGNILTLGGKTDGSLPDRYPETICRRWDSYSRSSGI